jgi:hypothetical protein
VLCSCFSWADSSLKVSCEHLLVLAAYLPRSVRIFTGDAVLQLRSLKETCFSPAIELGAVVIGLVVLPQEWISVSVDVVRDLSMVLVGVIAGAQDRSILFQLGKLDAVLCRL